MLFDNPADLEPESVLNWLSLCTAGLALQEQEATRLLDGAGPPPQGLIDELGLGASRAQVTRYFAMCRQELELNAILTMIAAAEARIRLDTSARIARGTGDLAGRLKLLRDQVELEWQIALYEHGIIDAWKLCVASLTALPDAGRAHLLGAMGGFKNLLRVRHWVAHGRYWQPQWRLERFAPADVAEAIHELYGALREVAAQNGLIAF